MALIDVVNFNGDASCLCADKWLYCLQGGNNSPFFQMLKNYVDFQRKVNLGITGVTVKDIAHFNPEAIDFINAHPEIFEIICRPYAHDSPLLRTSTGFRLNLEKGLQVIRSYFNKVNDFYLAPELMKTAQQIKIIRDCGLQGIFISKDRFEDEIAIRIPNEPHLMKGVLGTKLLCIPFSQKKEYSCFLDVIHGYLKPEKWIDVLKYKRGNYYFWRDGESCLLLPFGVEYERRLFETEMSSHTHRLQLSEIDFQNSPGIKRNGIKSYPYHSLKPWFKDMKLYWLTSRIRDIELKLADYPEIIHSFWFLLINSDIMASVEKTFPVINVGSEVFNVQDNSPLWNGIIPHTDNKTLTLLRCDRGVEGEDYLAYLDLILENKMDAGQVIDMWKNAKEAYLRKAYARIYDDVTQEKTSNTKYAKVISDVKDEDKKEYEKQLAKSL